MILKKKKSLMPERRGLCVYACARCKRNKSKTNECVLASFGSRCVPAEGGEASSSQSLWPEVSVWTGNKLRRQSALESVTKDVPWLPDE